MSIAAQVQALEKRNAALEAACATLVKMYVIGLNGKADFIACITPKHAVDMTTRERKQCEVWAAWDAACRALGSGTYYKLTKGMKGEA